MSARTEAVQIGIGLTSSGIALVGTFAGFASMSFVGLNSGAPLVLWLPFLVGVPALLVAGFLSLLGFATKWRLHPLTTALGTAVGELIAVSFINIFFLFGLLFFPLLFTLAAFLISRYLLERPPLAERDLALVALSTLSLYIFFANGPLSIGLGRTNIPGCSDGCGPTENLLTAVVVLALGALIVIAAAFCYRNPSGRQMPVSEPRVTL
jgi:hypothetical protein